MLAEHVFLLTPKNKIHYIDVFIVDFKQVFICWEFIWRDLFKTLSNNSRNSIMKQLNILAQV